MDGQLDLSDWMDERASEYDRSRHILNDIQYILSTTPNASTWSVKMRKNFVKGVQALINLIGKLQLVSMLCIIEFKCNYALCNNKNKMFLVFDFAENFELQ